MNPQAVCIGAAHWDIVARAADAPAPGEDLPGRIALRPGGVAFNAALALAQGGIATSLVSAIGRDAEGSRLLALAAEAGVGIRHVCRLDLPTGRYLAIEAPDGALFAAVADCAALDAASGILANALDEIAAGPRPAVVLADGNLDAPVLTRLLALPVERLVLVPASPSKAVRLRPLLARGRTCMILNRREAEAVLGRALRDTRMAAGALCAAGAREAVVTDGAAPATRTGPSGAVTLEPPEAAGGTTGAGDAFAAALVAADLAGLDPRASLARALEAASRHIAEAP